MIDTEGLVQDRPTQTAYYGTPMHISITEIAYASGMLIGGLLLGLFGNYQKRILLITASIFMMGISLTISGLLPHIDKDDVSYVCGHCFRSISSLNQVLFAVNKEYCINEKKAVKMIEDFKIKPSDYKERVDKVISLISTDVECTRKGIEILQRLVNEVEHLKGADIQ